MSYDYQAHREWLFTEKGQVCFLAIRDQVHKLLKTAGAFQMIKITDGKCPTNWHAMACVDRLVELKEIKELTQRTPSSSVPGQYRTFVKQY